MVPSAAAYEGPCCHSAGLQLRRYGAREPHLKINLLLSQKRRNSATCHQAKGTLVQLKDGPPGRLLHLF